MHELWTEPHTKTAARGINITTVSHPTCPSGNTREGNVYRPKTEATINRGTIVSADTSLHLAPDERKAEFPKTSRCFLLAALFLLSATAAYGQLSQSFYAGTCPNLEGIIKTEVSRALSAEKRRGASLLRLFFHDCFVQGCDASVLLGSDVPNSERLAGPNANSLRGFEVIDTIKSQVEAACPRTVSCADILAIATRDAVVELGGPTWTLRLGRRDSLTANKAQAESDLPSPGSRLSELKSAFGKKGFTDKELVTLSGAHTIGLALCTFADGDPLQVLPDCVTSGMRTPLDRQTPQAFDNKYYDNLIKNQGLLHSDNVLMTDGKLKSLIEQYNSDLGRKFRDDFAAVMKKMSELQVLTGGQGQIRLNCNRVN